MANAICGDSVDVKVNGGITFLGHKVALNLTGTPQDVRHFGSGVFGDWLTCQWTGEVVINSYAAIPNAKPPSAVGAAVTASINITSNNMTVGMTNCALTDIKRDVDAKGLEEFTYTFKVTGSPSIS